MSDDQNRWPRVKSIFDSALARAPHERADFLREACGVDVVLRGEVESLLAAHAEAGHFAEHPAIDALATSDFLTANSVVPALSPGFEIGSYRIVGSLDSGGMGEVYRARDTRLRRDVAVKVLPAAFSKDPERVARLQREARLLAVLNHPNIATIHGLEEARGVHALVMELIEGPTLADRLSSGPLAPNLALEIARQIADALDAAHEKGIVHRDLKLANIKLTATGAVKVLDFGLAKAIVLDPHDASNAPTVTGAVTHEGMIAGTPAYMSPEQARGQHVDKRTDVWAFGCVLYEMLTGLSAFSRPTVTDTLAAVLEREPEWTQLPQSVPASIRRLLHRCLEKDLRRRLHDMADARIEIEAAQREPEESTHIRAPLASRTTTWLLAIATGVLAVGLAVVFVVFYLRPTANAPEMRVEITTPPGPDPTGFAISPDGGQLAFVAEHEGQSKLWLRPLNSASAHSLPGTEGAREPFWSPDGRSVGFFTPEALKRVDVRGGPVQTLATGGGGTGGTWSQGGTILFSNTAGPSLMRVMATGGPPVAATKPAGGSIGHRFPQFLPGGRNFVFYGQGAEDARGVYLGSLDSTEVTRLTPADTKAAYLPPGWLLFVRQGTLVAQRLDQERRALTGEPVRVAKSVDFEPLVGGAGFSASETGVIAYRTAQTRPTQLSWFDRSGNTLGTVGQTEQAGVSNIAVSPDGLRVAAERTVPNDTNVWLFDSTRAMRLTSPPTFRRFPTWSPDGSRIAFETTVSGSWTLSARPSSGGGEEEILLESPGVKIPCDWSPDGRFLLYFVPAAAAGTDLWVLPLDGKRVPFPFLKTEFSEIWGQFSPDGRWVAYQSNESGRNQIYVRPFPGPGGQFPVSTGGGVYPRWAPSGKELYYIAPDGKLMAVPVSIRGTKFEAGTPKALFQTRRVGGGLNVTGRSQQYDVAPDGRFLINVEVEPNSTPITLLLNWKP